MFDLANYTLSELTENLTTLRKCGLGADSMEETANRMVRYLYGRFLLPGTTQHACPLVRLFITQPFGKLDDHLQSQARMLLGSIPESPAHKCLVLLGTAGDQPEWNLRQ
ncbi:MAG: hypothetical protein H8K05_22035 [Nitrospira sp.]|nr:hypothetical protein [Nitrospira sp.]